MSYRFKLYGAAFDHAPDTGGLAFWVSTLNQGASFKEVAAVFSDSPEFHHLYRDAPTNDQYVMALYQNTLHRAPDVGGAPSGRRRSTSRSSIARKRCSNSAQAPNTRTASRSTSPTAS